MNHKPNVWLNNQIISWESATVPILSHGFSRGSAIFEVFGTHDRDGDTLAFRMDRHLQRLQQTATLLGMEMKYSNDEIAKAVEKLASHNNLGNGLIKIMAYWSEEAVINLVLKSKLDVAIFTIPFSSELGLDNNKTLSACFSKWRKLDPATIPVQAKACANYLNGYIIRKDAIDRGFDLGLSIGTNDFVAEGSVESVFIVKDSVLLTPPLGGILAGVTRDTLIQLAKDDGIAVKEEPLTKEDVCSADEIFTCHTGLKVCPVNRIEAVKLQAPGVITQRLEKLISNVLTFQNNQYDNWFQKLKIR